jgi:hypothetical protein
MLCMNEFLTSHSGKGAIGVYYGPYTADIAYRAHFQDKDQSRGMER